MNRNLFAILIAVFFSFVQDAASQPNQPSQIEPEISQDGQWIHLLIPR